MADDDRHRPGTPCWVLLVTPDPARTGPFYASLFGWTVPPADAGFSTVESGKGEVAGVLALPPEAASAGAASHWLIYLATEDVGASLERVRAAGGSIVAPAFDIGPLGRMAMAADGLGAQFGLWEAGTHPGAVTGEVGSLTWAELRTRSRASAAGFYEAVFGWEVQAVQSGAEGFITCLLDDDPVAGMVQLSAADGQSPSFWMPYFAVTDCEASASLAESLGGEVCAPPHETGGLRLAVLRDPLGALFYVVEPQNSDGG
jgi:predicted enzyme related to lactoylglutathione lyase